MEFNQKIMIKNHIIDEKSPAFIIAEAGVNHNGNINLAKEMVDAAYEAGVDAVKFQAFKTRHLILNNIQKAPYQRDTSGGEESQYDMLKKLEVNFAWNMEIKQYCEKKNIIFLTTPFEEESLKEVNDLNVPAIKIAATDLTNIQYLRKVAKLQKPIILSAGMCYLEEVRMALEAINEYNKDVILLQCTANYPIMDEEANLKLIQILREEFHIITGYSDHSQGVGAAPFAAALGAKVIEKHFTLDKAMEGPDHRASVTPEELKELVRDVKRAEKYIGDGVKMPTASEQMTRKSLQKCIVAKKDISEGDIFDDENITAKRTGGNGILALYVDSVLGKRAKCDYKQNDIIEL